MRPYRPLEESGGFSRGWARGRQDLHAPWLALGTLGSPLGVLVWSLGVMRRSLEVLGGSLGDPLESWGCPWRYLGGPKGSLGGRSWSVGRSQGFLDAFGRGPPHEYAAICNEFTRFANCEGNQKNTPKACLGGLGGGP